MSAIAFDASFASPQAQVPAVPPVSGWNFFATAENAVDSGSGTASLLNDISGNGNGFMQPTAGSQPAITPNWLNGKGVLDYNVNKFLNSQANVDIVDPSGAFTVLTVGQMTTAGGTLIGFRRTLICVSAQTIISGASNTQYVFNNSTSAGIASGLPPTTGTPFWTLHVFHGVGIVPDFYVNGVLKTVVTPQPQVAPTGTLGSLLGRDLAGNFYSGKMGANGVLDHDVSVGEIATIAAWVNGYYGL